MTPRSDFYVYVLFRETGAPFYVGKGCGKRWKDHLKLCRRDTSHKSFNMPYVKVRENLTEPEAFMVEIALIQAIGREPKGPLANASNGGEGPTGRVVDAFMRMSSSFARIGLPSPRKGMTNTIEARAKMSASLKGRVSPNKGKPMSEAQKEKIRAAKIGKPLAPEHRAAITAAMRSKPGPNVGRIFSDEACKNMSDAHKGKPHTEKQKAAFQDRSFVLIRNELGQYTGRL